MLQNYLKIAFRNLQKQKVYAFINVAGLAVGIAFCALIFLYVRDELTFDRFHEQADRIYRVLRVGYNPDGSVHDAGIWHPFPLATALETDVPEVEHAVRFFDQPLLIRRGDKTLEQTILFADAAVFEVFSFPLLRGNPASALGDPNSIVLSEKAARTFFGETDPIGQTVEVRFGETYENVVVTGIAQNVPGNSSIRFDYLMPFAKLPNAYAWIRARENRWNASSFYTYVLLKDDATRADAEAKMPAFRAKYYPNEIEEMRREQGWTGDGPPAGFHLQPLAEIHLDPSVASGLTPPSDPRYSYILGGIALAILLIACINFTTLAIGRSTNRAREIGVRKVVGAQRRQLMAQFWGEALMLSFLALGAGVALAELFLPTFNALASKNLSFDYGSNATTAAALVGLMLLTGLIAGCYPALVLSGIRPIETLRRRLRLGSSNVLTRSLIVVQFALSMFLISGTLFMVRQLDYLRTKNLGFDKEQVVVIPTQRLPGSVLLERFRNDLGGRRDVRGITGISTSFTRGYSREGWMYRDEQKMAFVYRVESNYLDVMGIDLVAGRSFDPNLSTDTTAVLVNEALVRDFGWTDPIGQTLEGYADEPTVVGVFKDINFASLHDEVDPMMLTLDPAYELHHLLVRIAPGDVPATLDALQAAWQKSVPDVPFKYSFLDDDLDRQYQNEARWSKIVGYAAAFAIVIACLGLFGLAALTVAGRTKEIGIRKVMGASVANVTVLLSKDFARLVGLALLIATPLAYYAVHQWLNGFAYRIDISWLVFAVAGLTALGIALLTVSYQAIKAALADPVKALRYE